MSGIEVLGLISSIITVTDVIIAVYGSLKDMQDLPESFHEINNRLPLVAVTLSAAKGRATHVEEDDNPEALLKVLKGCKKKADQLSEIFQKIAKVGKKNKSVITGYRTLVLKLGKAKRVETLMENIVKDVLILTAHRIFAPVTQDKVKLLEDAQEELKKVSPSIPDSEFEAGAGVANNYGKDQLNNFGGTFNNVKGHMFNAKRDQNFGNIPPVSREKGSDDDDSDDE